MEPPDNLEKQVRFGCGFLFGGSIVGGILLFRLWERDVVIAGAVTAALICGWLAMRFGDVFWERIHWWWWG